MTKITFDHTEYQIVQDLTVTADLAAEGLKDQLIIKGARGAYYLLQIWDARGGLIAKRISGSGRLAVQRLETLEETKIRIRREYRDATNFGRADDRLSRTMSALLRYWRDSQEAEDHDRLFDGGEWSGPAHAAIRQTAQDLIAIDYGYTGIDDLIQAAKRVCDGRQLWMMGFIGG